MATRTPPFLPTNNKLAVVHTNDDKEFFDDNPDGCLVVVGSVAGTASVP